MDLRGALGPNGWWSSLKEYPLGCLANSAFASTVPDARAISLIFSTVLLSTSVILTCFIPLASCILKLTIFILLLPIHASGVSISNVSPFNSVTRGPTNTFGYPILPTKTDGGLVPSIVLPNFMAGILGGSLSSNCFLLAYISSSLANLL